MKGSKPTAGAIENIAMKGLSKANNLTGRQAYKLGKQAIKQTGKTARMVESGKTKRSAARATAGTASVTSASSNVNMDDTRKQYDRKEGQYDGLAMGGIGTSDDAEQVMSANTAEETPGHTKVWL